MDKCVNTCVHHWAALVQFYSNLYNFVSIFPPCLWFVTIANSPKSDSYISLC